MKILMPWSEFDRAADEIAVELVKKGLIGRFKMICGVPRGGLILAVVLSHKMRIPLLPMDPVHMKGQLDDILIVDDISDTGKTLLEIEAPLTATIHYVEGSAFTPTVWARKKIKGDWIIYPWESKY